MRIRNGRHELHRSLLMNTAIHRALGLSLLCMACLPLSAGCSSARSASPLIERTTTRAQADAWVQDTHAELAALRRDLAAARIATSKQEGEATELRRKTTILEADRAALRTMLQQAHANALQIDQDALRQALAQAQAVSLAAQNSNTTPKLAETDVQADMTALNARMAQLTDELAQLKQRFPNNVRTTAVRPRRASSDRTAEAAPGPMAQDEPTQPRIVPSALLLPPSEATSRPGHAADLSPQQSLIRVQPGDSLWKLAHAHATTIDELKRINGLTTDVVQAGQRLILPSRGEPDGRQCVLASRCTDPVNEISRENDRRE